MKKLRVWLFVTPFILFFNFLIILGVLNEYSLLESVFLRENVLKFGRYASGSFTDIKFHFRGPEKPKNKIIIVEIDDESLNMLGRWPWERGMIAYLIDQIFSHSAKALGLDIFFTEKQEMIPDKLKEKLISNKLSYLMNEFDTDSTLAAAVKDHKNQLVLGWGSDSYCSPLYLGEEGCPKDQIEGIDSHIQEFKKFKLNHFKKDIGINHTISPFLSIISLNQNIDVIQNEALYSGSLNAIKDSDGVIRKSPLFYLGNQDAYPVIALEMAHIGLKEEPVVELDQNGRLKKFYFKNSLKELPIPPNGFMEFNFRGPADSFVYVSASELFSDAEEIRLWPGRFYPMSKVPFDCFTCSMEKNKEDQEILMAAKNELFQDAYVFLGVSALGMNDIRSYPFDRHVPGVEGHATILDNILSFDPLKSSSNSYGIYFLFIFSILGGILLTLGMNYFGSISSVLLLLASLLVVFLVDFVFLFSRNINIDSIWIYLEYIFIFTVVFILKYMDEEKDKKFLKGAFSKYVAPAMVDAIVKDPSKLSLGGEKKELTILFSDIRSFTTLSEKMDAKVLAQFLNDYLGKMTEIVFQNKGTLDKFIGDALMAFWGAPLDVADHAYRCCIAAIQMQKKVEADQDFYKKNYDIEVHVGVGLHTGVVNVGNMGSKDNFNFTVIGDDVNLSSRLEGLTKEYGVAILTSRATIECVKKSGHPVPKHRVIDLVKVKGKKVGVEIIELCIKEYSEDFLRHFAEGRFFYLNRKWDEAISKFKLAIEEHRQLFNSADVASERFIEICNLFKENPPEADWDGSWQMTSK